MEYKGYIDKIVSNEEMASFYEGTLDNFNLLENEYLVLRDSENKIIDYFIYKNKKLEKLKYPCFDSLLCGKTKPRNSEQYMAMDLLFQREIPVKALTGKFGCGKSYLMINGAIQLLQKGTFDKIIYIRNNIQVKDTDSLGALPGLI